MLDVTYVVERDANQGLYVASVPGWPDARALGSSIEELRRNFEVTVRTLLEDGPQVLDTEFVGVQTLRID